MQSQQHQMVRTLRCAQEQSRIVNSERIYGLDTQEYVDVTGFQVSIHTKQCKAQMYCHLSGTSCVCTLLFFRLVQGTGGPESTQKPTLLWDQFSKRKHSTNRPGTCVHLSKFHEHHCTYISIKRCSSLLHSARYESTNPRCVPLVAV